MLATPEFSSCGLLRQMNVKVLCTTDDPVDNLEHHKKIMEGDFCQTKVLPAFRPDRAMAIEDPVACCKNLDTLGLAADVSISTYDDLVKAVRVRHDYFHENGCRLSDHGLEQPYYEEFNEKSIREIFSKIRAGKGVDKQEIKKFKTSILFDLARLDAEKNWTQQFHFGALRNTNDGALKRLGPDTGYDSIGDFEIGRPLAQFFNVLATENKLAKNIVYNLNPGDNELLATMIGNYQDGSLPGKMEFGSGWWFNDQKDGMER
jgi:glucuronate isomerase